MSNDPAFISPSDGLLVRLGEPSKKSELAYINPRPATASPRLQDVERVIVTMQQHLDEPLSLDALAKVALLSRFHFSRVFHHVTGLPPVQFLAALRLAEAKRLLLTSSLNVTDICYRVGYNSLGTFTAHFSKSVGISPNRFRKLRQPFNLGSFNDNYDDGLESSRVASTSLANKVSGRIHAQASLAGPVFVGLFKTSAPEGQPIRCAILEGAGVYRMDQVPEGTYHVLAASFPWPDDGPSSLLPGGESLQVGKGGTVHVARGEALQDVDLWLRPSRPTDPPVLVALPALLARLDAANGRLI